MQPTCSKRVSSTGCHARGRIRRSFSMTYRKGCGLTTTSCRQMWFENGPSNTYVGAGFSRPEGDGPPEGGPYVVVLAMILAFAVNAHAQSVLADRIQAGDRRAALAMIAQGADVNQ